jgi:hypothetical protein
MRGHNHNSEKVKVFSDKKFEGMNVDGIQVPPTRRLLAVMMLMDEGVNRPQMKETMEESIEKVVEEVEGGE